MRVTISLVEVSPSTDIMLKVSLTTSPSAAFSSITRDRAPSTPLPPPVTLVYLEQAEDHSQALRREAALKRLSRKESWL